MNTSVHKAKIHINQTARDYLIPRLLHRYYPTSEIPRGTYKMVTSWNKHIPALQSWFWTQSAAANFTREKLNTLSENFTFSIPKDYKNFREEQYEILKFLVLSEYGGIFTKLDVELLKSLDGEILSRPCVIAQEPLANSLLMYEKRKSVTPFASSEIIICSQGHKFLRFVVENIIIMIENGTELGRFYFHDLVQKYLEMSDKQEAALSQKDEIYLAPPEYFMPTYSNSKTSTKWIWEFCHRILSWEHYPGERAKLQYELCQELSEKNFSNKASSVSYTKHHWHQVNGNKTYRDFAIESIVPNVKVL